MLSLMTFVPFLGAIIILFIPRQNKDLVRAVAVVATGIPLLLAAQVFWVFYTQGGAQMKFVEMYDWIKPFNIQYFMGIDGVSAPMVILTALLGFICIFASWNIEKGVKAYFALFLILETGMMGVFCALDFFLFYVYWEVMLLPMYFLIGIWGGPRKEYAAIKFFVYTLAGSVLMLLVMLAMYFNTNIAEAGPNAAQHTFNLLLLTNQNMHIGILQNFDMRLLLYIGLFIAFAIKVPVFPFHTWLPDAHVEAPTAISVILAGVLLKMGTYGIFRISFPLLPDMAQYTSIGLAVFGMINIIYGALCAMAQDDLKKLVAYSSISHMGYCLLGMGALTAAGMNGALLQMFNHGTITGMLFLLVGVIYERAHHRNVDGFGGLATKVPVYAGIMGFAFFASLGLPGMSGFISEALCFIGGFEHDYLHVITAVSTLGIVITAAYLLWTFQKIFLGPFNNKYDNLQEINGRELFTLVPLGIIVVILGFFPSIILNIMGGGINTLMNIISKGAGHWSW
ncbi:MAG: NADH-quinone oxidoreductase subunit M [Planctomycetes bacterium]|nr:NADH-quinone oxidoreductase subunit M [Planctomycetota bacterium]